MDNIRKNSKKIKNISVCSFPQKKSLFSAIVRFREGQRSITGKFIIQTECREKKVFKNLCRILWVRLAIKTIFLFYCHLN